MLQINCIKTKWQVSWYADGSAMWFFNIFWDLFYSYGCFACTYICTPNACLIPEEVMRLHVGSGKESRSPSQEQVFLAWWSNKQLKSQQGGGREEKVELTERGDNMREIWENMGLVKREEIGGLQGLAHQSSNYTTRQTVRNTE